MVILIAGVIFAFYPVWFAILASGRPGQSLYTLNLAGMFLPVDWTWANYQYMLFESDLFIWITNSLKVASITAVASIVICTSAAFAFARFRFWGRAGGLTFMLALQTFPQLLALTAIGMILTAIGLYGKHLGLILAYTAGTLVFSTWNLKGYFDTIPVDLEEAGMIDGAGPVQSFFMIALPLARPALAITFLLGFLAGWGDFAFANILVPAPSSLKLATPALYGMANNVGIPWGQFAAGFVFVAIPTIILFMYLQRYLQTGLTLGGVKG
jgi:arabinogalactan oligomer/maltooligosaccharide transport system permease protein